MNHCFEITTFFCSKQEARVKSKGFHIQDPPFRIWLQLAVTHRLKERLVIPDIWKDCTLLRYFKSHMPGLTYDNDFYVHRPHAWHTSLSCDDKCKLLLDRFTLFFLFNFAISRLGRGKKEAVSVGSCFWKGPCPCQWLNNSQINTNDLGKKGKIPLPTSWVEVHFLPLAFKWLLRLIDHVWMATLAHKWILSLPVDANVAETLHQGCCDNYAFNMWHLLSDAQTATFIREKWCGTSRLMAALKKKTSVRHLDY